MIVKKLEEVQLHLPSFNFKVDANRINDFISRSQAWLVDWILGDGLESALESTPANPDPHEKLRGLAQRVICVDAYLCSMDELNLQLSEAGFVVQNNQSMSPASQQRTDQLRLSLQSRLNDDCDALVKHLLKNSLPGTGDHTLYNSWRETEQFKLLSSVFMPTMAIAKQNTADMPVTTWKDFANLIPTMDEALRTVVAGYVSEEEIDALLELYRANNLSDTHRRVLRWIRFAVMADVSGRRDNARHFAIEARNYMLQNESDFSEFVNSDRYNLPSPFNMGDGTVANLL